MVIINIFLYAIFSLIPALGWLSICLYFDRQAPEPKKEIWRMFFLGMVIILPVMLITGPLTFWADRYLGLPIIAVIVIISFLVDSLFEEVAKYLVLRKGIYSRSVFDEPRDGMIYGMTVGIGFAFLESILYAATSPRLIEGVSLIFLRAISASFMHFLAGGIVGYYLGLAKFQYKSRQGPIIGRGIFLAIIFHGLYNTIVRAGNIWHLLPMSLLLIGVYFFILKGLRHLARWR